MRYSQGLCKSIKRICRKYGIQTHFKGNSNIKNVLVSPREKDQMVNKSGAIHWFQCSELWEIFREHLKDPSSIHHHSSNIGHPISQNNFQIVGREGHGLARNIKESIFIRVNNPTLNRNIGKFNLTHMWDRVLLNTSGLNIKMHAQAVGHANSNQPNIPTNLNQPNIPTHLGQPNSPVQFFTGSELAYRTSQNPLKVQYFRFSLRPDEVQLLAGWKFVFNQQMFCSRESTYYKMYQYIWLLTHSEFTHLHPFKNTKSCTIT